jgi:hypothetical protein
VAALEFDESQTGVVDSQDVENRCVQVVDVDGGNVVTEIVGFPMSYVLIGTFN